MARCERGYLCVVCGEEVEALTDSDLYLRYTLGEVEPETLHKSPERHIRCNPILAQFIVANEFPPVEVDGAFSKRLLDGAFVASEEARVTSGYRRLHELTAQSVPIHEYPLPREDRADDGPAQDASS
jgi:hypothetical protein